MYYVDSPITVAVLLLLSSEITHGKVWEKKITVKQYQKDGSEAIMPENNEIDAGNATDSDCLRWDPRGNLQLSQSKDSIWLDYCEGATIELPIPVKGCLRDTGDHSGGTICDVLRLSNCILRFQGLVEGHRYEFTTKAYCPCVFSRMAPCPVAIFTFPTITKSRNSEVEAKPESDTTPPMTAAAPVNVSRQALPHAAAATDPKHSHFSGHAIITNKFVAIAGGAAVVLAIIICTYKLLQKRKSVQAHGNSGVTAPLFAGLRNTQVSAPGVSTDSGTVESCQTDVECPITDSTGRLSPSSQNMIPISPSLLDGY